MVHDFPNLFFLMGPNGTGLQSALQTIEPAADFAVGAVVQMSRDGIAALSPTQASVDAFTRNVRDRFEQTTHSKGCTSWWSEATGHNHSIWPGSVRSACNTRSRGLRRRSIETTAPTRTTTRTATRTRTTTPAPAPARRGEREDPSETGTFGSGRHDRRDREWIVTARPTGPVHDWGLSCDSH